MLTDLFTWWTEQMRDLVPASARSFLDRRWRPELLATADLPDTSSVALSLRTGGGETALGRHGLTGTGLREALARLPRARRAAAVLRTPADLLLEQEVVLPLSAEQDLRQVVEYEMDRLTPFRAEQLNLLDACQQLVQQAALSTHRLADLVRDATENHAIAMPYEDKQR